MWQDPILLETRILRDDYAKEFNYDITEMCKDLMAKQAIHPERIVSFPPRKPRIQYNPLSNNISLFSQ